MNQEKRQALCPICINWPSVGNVRLNFFRYGQNMAGVHFPEFIRVIELLSEVAYSKKSVAGSSKKMICRKILRGCGVQSLKGHVVRPSSCGSLNRQSLKAGPHALSPPNLYRRNYFFTTVILIS